MEAIISHVSADFDSLASMVAAKKLYPRARLFFTGPPEQAVRDFMNLYKDFIRVETVRNPASLGIKKLIIVDCRNPNRLGDFRDLVNDPRVEVHVYDHHPPTCECIKGDLNVIENLGASTTILVKKILEKNIPFSPLEATLMCLGIYEETGSLLFTTTTWEDVLVVSRLMKKGVQLTVVSDFIFQYLNEEQRKLLNDLILSSYILRIKGFRVLVAVAKREQYIDGLALVTHRLKDMERMDAVFTLVDMAGKIYMVGRSIRPEIDVSYILKFFDGGGHATASSAVVKNDDIKKVEDRLKFLLKTKINPSVSAQDIMSSPVLTLELSQGQTIKDAYDHMYKIGHFHLPIVKNGKLVGIIDRKDVDKAERHGYRNAPLEVYMSKPVITTYPDASIYQLQNIMMEKGVGCLPVLENGNLKGMVTRSDVLEAIHKRDLSRQKRQLSSREELNHLPEYVRNILRTAGRVGDKLKMRTYIVGGFVRDLLMGAENLDMDIVVEGDGILFGQELAQEMKGRSKYHEKFGTSIVSLPDGLHIDVVTSRTEYYTRPAALPEVMASSIKQDLYRRDFTINAMAIRLNHRYFGELMDFFGCRKDLKNGVIRVLHNLSFIDDPTRILRAVKFEQRYHFRMEPITESLLKDALSHSIFDQVSAERFRNEFIEILQEARPFDAIKRMDKLRILKLLHKDINIDGKMQEVFENIAVLLLQFAEVVRTEKVLQWVIYFSALVMRLPPEDIEGIAEKFRVPENILQKVNFNRDKIHQIIRSLSNRNLSPGEVYNTLHGLSIESLIFMMARTQSRIVRAKIAQYLNVYRHIKPLITGEDLKQWQIKPGPVYKKILKILFTAQLDGHFESKEGAKNFYQTRMKALLNENGNKGK